MSKFIKLIFLSFLSIGIFKNSYAAESVSQNNQNKDFVSVKVGEVTVPSFKQLDEMMMSALQKNDKTFCGKISGELRHNGSLYSNEVLKRRCQKAFDSFERYKHDEFDKKRIPYGEFTSIQKKAAQNKDVKICQEIKADSCLQDMCFGQSALINKCEDEVAKALDQHLICKSSLCLLHIARDRAVKGKDFLDVCERIKYLDAKDSKYGSCLEAKSYKGK